MIALPTPGTGEPNPCPPPPAAPSRPATRRWARALATWLVNRRVPPNGISLASLGFAAAGALAMLAAPAASPGGRAALLRPGRRLHPVAPAVQHARRHGGGGGWARVEGRGHLQRTSGPHRRPAADRPRRLRDRLRPGPGTGLDRRDAGGVHRLYPCPRRDLPACPRASSAPWPSPTAWPP